jgi:hypothetical protein
MATEIATASNAGVGGLAHYDLLDRIRVFCTTNSTLVGLGQAWTVLRYDTTAANRELIMQAPGLSGTEQIFIGLRTYQDSNADIYNLAVSAFTGFVAGNTFDTQPGALVTGVPAHNISIPYWLNVNGQRLVLAMKVGTPVYESIYLGKFLPYATPGQYPYPVITGGMLSGVPLTRFSDTTHSMPYKPNAAGMRLRFVDGLWKTVQTWPYDTAPLQSMFGPQTPLGSRMRDTESQYSIDPIVLSDSANIYGELDGVGFVTGFNNAVENTFTLGTDTWVVIQDVGRTSFGDYYAMRLD